MPTITKPISAAACRRIHTIALSDGTITDKVKSDRAVARPGGQAIHFPSVVVATAAALSLKGVDPNLASRTLIITTLLKVQGEGDFVAKYLKDIPQPLPTAKPAKAAPAKPVKAVPAKPVKAATPAKPKAAVKPKAVKARPPAKQRSADLPPPADTGETEAPPEDASLPPQAPEPTPPRAPQEKAPSRKPEPEPEPVPDGDGEDAPETSETAGTAETSERQGVDDTALPAESPGKTGTQPSVNRVEPRRGGGAKAPYVHMIGVVSLLIGAIQLLEANDRNNGYKRRQDTLGALIEDCSQYAQVP